MNKKQLTDIANLMVKASNEILIAHAQSWLNENYQDHIIKFRVGSGKSTNHTYFPNSKLHVITFGLKMIESKTNSIASLRNWLTFKEIYARNYFNSKGNIQTALACTVAHEVAHLFQSLMYPRKRNSVHNENFYSILDKMHKNGHVEKVYNYLMEHDIFKNLEFNVKSQEEEHNICHENDFKVGSAIYFRCNGKIHIDIIVAVNKLKIRCKCANVSKSSVFKVEHDLNKIDKNLLLKEKVPSQYSKENTFVGEKISFLTNNGITEQVIVKTGKNYVFTQGYRVPYSLILKK